MGKRIKKHTFDCGHVGLGQFCHRCQQADKLQAALDNLDNGEEIPLSVPGEIKRLRAVS